MPARTASAHWEGTVREGKGTVSVGSGLFDGAPYSFGARFDTDAGTNPEELLGAAHAGCFTMYLSLLLTNGGHTATRLDTKAAVTIEVGDEGPRITGIALETEGVVPGLGAAAFEAMAAGAARGCPVSVALASVPITHTAKLTGG